MIASPAPQLADLSRYERLRLAGKLWKWYPMFGCFAPSYPGESGIPRVTTVAHMLDAIEGED